MIETQERIRAQRVADNDRMDFLPSKLPGKFLQFEGATYDQLRGLTRDYAGGYWDFYDLTNGGFFIAPHGAGEYAVNVASNGYHGTMSHEAAGITASLYALNAMCWKYHEERYNELYHHLRDFALEHAEAAAILGAID